MPYIDKMSRKLLTKKLRELWELPPLSAGKINFIITSFLLQQLPENARYEDFNKMLGVLESIKLEFYRRAVSPYEDKARDSNGEIY